MATAESAKFRERVSRFKSKQFLTKASELKLPSLPLPCPCYSLAFSALPCLGHGKGREGNLNTLTKASSNSNILNSELLSNVR
jgi:hypothetical protein